MKANGERRVCDGAGERQGALDVAYSAVCIPLIIVMSTVACLDGGFCHEVVEQEDIQWSVFKGVRKPCRPWGSSVGYIYMR
jgi:hypothetical protein